MRSTADRSPRTLTRLLLAAGLLLALALPVHAALQGIGPSQWPMYPIANPSASLGSTPCTIDATGEQCANVFQIPRTGTIDRLLIRMHSVTVSDDLLLSLQTVSATTGEPTGTNYGGGSTCTITAASVTTGLLECDPGTDYTVTVGDYVACVQGVTFVDANLQVGFFNYEGGQSRVGVPYGLSFAAAWTKQGAWFPSCGVRYSDGTYAYIHNTMPLNVVTQITDFDTASAIDERGNVWDVDAPQRIIGLGCQVACAFGGPGQLLLYNAAGTVLCTVTVDQDIRAATGAATYSGPCAEGPVTLSTGLHRLVVKPTDGTLNITVFDVTGLSAAQLDAFPGGQHLYRTTRADAGAWTDTTSARTWGLFVILDQIDDGVGGGSGGAHILGGSVVR